MTTISHYSLDNRKTALYLCVINRKNTGRCKKMKQNNHISFNNNQQVYLGILNQNQDCFKGSDTNVTSNAFKCGQQENTVADHFAAIEFQPFLLSNDQLSASNYTVSVLSFYGYVNKDNKKDFLKKM